MNILQNKCTKLYPSYSTYDHSNSAYISYMSFHHYHTIKGFNFKNDTNKINYYKCKVRL